MELDSGRAEMTGLLWPIENQSRSDFEIVVDSNCCPQNRKSLRERFKIKKLEKKLTNVSFMYVCVAGNGEMLVFFSFFPPTIV